MIYRPKEELLWDCWICPHEGKFYMFYLSVSPERIGRGSFDGISLAISDDMVHWKEYGKVFHKRPEAAWIGTGMIQKIGDIYIMSFSEEYPLGSQNIFFATSRDLLHWERTGHICSPDGVYYMNKPTDMSNAHPRWDALVVIDALKQSEPPYYAFVTASSKKVNQINKNGGLGLVTSMDGLNWTCLPDAFGDTDMFPQFEVPEHVEINGRHYVMFCTSSYLSHRFDRYARDMSGGTFYVVSDEVLGPYRLPECDYMLQGTRDHPAVSTVSVGRPLPMDGELVYYHIWGGDDGAEGWVGTIKLLEERAPYALQLRYHPRNDSMKDKLLANMQDVLPGLKLVKNDGVIPPMEFDLSESIRFGNLGTGAALYAAPLNGATERADSSDLSDGRMVDFDLKLGEGEGAGFYFEGAQGSRLCVMLNRKRQRLEFGLLRSGWGPGMVIRDEIMQEVAINENSRVKIIARKWFFEVYIDDIYVSSWRTEEQVDPNRVGFYFEDCSGELSNLEIWQLG